MSCCGNKRESLKQSSSLQVAQQETDDPPKMWNDVTFEYTGEGIFTVKGSVTGINYQFNETGNRIAVDYRDAGGMRGEPLLKKVS